MADVVSPVAIASGSRHSRKKTVENWDDDFDYGSIKPAFTSSTGAAYVVTAESKQGRASPDSIVSSWDDSPPQTALSSHHMVTRAKTEPSALARLEGRAPHFGPPRHSPSHTAGLPRPSVLSPRNQQFDINIPPESGLSRSKTNATPAAAGRQKLIKRHPSTSFVVMAQPDRSTSSLSSTAHTNRSSPHLPRSPSSGRMPPPPLPLGLERRKSRGKQKAGRPDGVRISSIPFSPSQEGIRDGERKPGFWKRFSGMPAGEKRCELRLTDSFTSGADIQTIWMRPTDLGGDAARRLATSRLPRPRHTIHQYRPSQPISAPPRQHQVLQTSQSYRKCLEHLLPPRIGPGQLQLCR